MSEDRLVSDRLSQDVHACGAEQRLFGVQCQLPFGHDDPHRHEDAGGVTTWEPTYVAALRREVEQLREAYEALARGRDAQWDQQVAEVERLRAALEDTATKLTARSLECNALRDGIRDLQRKFEARKPLHTSDFTRVSLALDEDQAP